MKSNYDVLIHDSEKDEFLTVGEVVRQTLEVGQYSIWIQEGDDSPLSYEYIKTLKNIENLTACKVYHNHKLSNITIHIAKGE